MDTLRSSSWRPPKTQTTAGDKVDEMIFEYEERRGEDNSVYQGVLPAV